MFPTKDNHIDSNDHQSYGNNCQIWISFHRLFPPYINKIKNNYNNATDYRCEKISIGNIPFNHDSTPLIDCIEITKNTNAMGSEMPSPNRESKIFEECIRIGEITPTVNHATATLPKISEALSNCFEDNPLIRDTLKQEGTGKSRYGIVKMLLFLFMFLFLCVLSTNAGAVGQGGLDFDVLSVGVGARPLGMGGAFTAVADNADAPYWNPAGLGYQKSHEITTMQTRLSTDADHYYVSYVQPLWKGTLGISWIQISAGSLSNTSATLDAYNEVNTLGIFSYFSNAYLLSYGLKINEMISAGLTAKYLSSDMSKISGGQGYGYSVTPGIMLKPNDLFTIGLRIDEILNKVVWGTGTAEKAPPKLHLGIAARPVFPKISGLFSLDFSQTMKEGYIGSVAIGYEWERQGLSLRCGYADSSFSAGAGFESGVARIDYAYVEATSLTKNNCHRISLSGKW